MTLAAIACLWLTTATPNVHVAPNDRHAYLVTQLEVEEGDTKVWYWAWGAWWVGSTAVQFATWPWTPVADRPSLVAWGISSAVGAVLTLALRPAAFGSAQRARDGDADAEWVKVHDDEVFNRSIWQQLGCVVLNVAPFLILGIGYKRWDWQFLAAGLVLSELQLFSFPQLLRRFGVLP